LVTWIGVRTTATRTGRKGFFSEINRGFTCPAWIRLMAGFDSKKRAMVTRL
jgi:hypothetical protein